MTEFQTTAKERTQTTVTTLEKVESPSLQTYYANSVDILMSVYDFVITVGQMRAASPDKVIIEQQARLVMSPQHTKMVVKLLADKLDQYEQSFGLIPEPPSEPQQPSEQSPDAAQD